MGYTIKRTSQYKKTPFIERKDYTTILLVSKRRQHKTHTKATSEPED